MFLSAYLSQNDLFLILLHIISHWYKHTEHILSTELKFMFLFWSKYNTNWTINLKNNNDHPKTLGTQVVQNLAHFLTLLWNRYIACGINFTPFVFCVLIEFLCTVCLKALHTDNKKEYRVFNIVWNSAKSEWNTKQYETN